LLTSYLIRANELLKNPSGDAKSQTSSQSGKVAEPKLGLLKEQKNALGLGGKK